MSAPELELAATVTRGAVGCSAWLGVAGVDPNVPKVFMVCFAFSFIISVLIGFMVPAMRFLQRSPNGERVGKFPRRMSIVVLNWLMSAIWSSWACLRKAASSSACAFWNSICCCKRSFWKPKVSRAEIHAPTSAPKTVPRTVPLMPAKKIS